MSDNILIVTKLDELISPSKDYTVVRLDENFWNENEILAFIPNREIPLITQAICFIPYSRQNDFNYRQNARAIKYQLGDENCLVLDTNITYPLHKKLELSYEEELNILIMAIEFFLLEADTVTITHRIDLSDKQSKYLEKLISDDRIKILYE